MFINVVILVCFCNDYLKCGVCCDGEIANVVVLFVEVMVLVEFWFSKGIKTVNLFINGIINDILYFLCLVASFISHWISTQAMLSLKKCPLYVFCYALMLI